MQWPGNLIEAQLRASPEAIRLYAEITRDFNPLHLDADFAAKTPFGRPIAHGTLSLAVLWEAIAATFGPDARPATAEMRFLAPIVEGALISATGTRAGADDPLAATMRYDFTVTDEAGTQALAGSVEITRGGADAGP